MQVLKQIAPRHLALAGMCSIALALGACGTGSDKNPLIPGVRGPNLTFVDQKIILSATLENVQFDFGARVPIPHLGNSYVEVGPDLQSKGLMISIGADLGDITQLLKGEINQVSPQALPGGRPLPGVAAGELPALAVAIQKLDNLVVYIGPKVIGFFIPVKFPKEMNGFMVSSRFYDTEGNRIGTVSVVGPDSSNRNGGVLVLLPIEGKVSQAMVQG